MYRHDEESVHEQVMYECENETFQDLNVTSNDPNGREHHCVGNDCEIGKNEDESLSVVSNLSLPTLGGSLIEPLCNDTRADGVGSTWVDEFSLASSFSPNHDRSATRGVLCLAS
jgi:hypothetical protein